MTPYARDEQISIAGPAITLSAEAVQPLSLVAHELATNALKHGALSCETGRVSVAWRFDGETLRLQWMERGGPLVREPERLGFGSKLLQITVERQLDAKLNLNWLSPGLLAEIVLPSNLFSMDGEGQGGASGSSTAGGEDLDGRGRKVLVVEDEGLVALELCGELRRLGWNVFGPAGTIPEAEEIVRSNPALDAAILDVNLRGRSVYALAEDLAKRNVPFVFCTGYEIVDPAGQFQSVPVIRKPAHKGAAAAALQRLLAA
jgi:CheY-like chemotaxis protein